MRLSLHVNHWWCRVRAGWVKILCWADFVFSVRSTSNQAQHGNLDARWFVFQYGRSFSCGEHRYALIVSLQHLRPAWAHLPSAARSKGCSAQHPLDFMWMKSRPLHLLCVIGPLKVEKRDSKFRPKNSEILRLAGKFSRKNRDFWAPKILNFWEKRTFWD